MEKKLGPDLSSSPPTHPGHCLCGDIAYQASGPSVFMANCHCRDCQRATGTGSAPVMMFPVAKVEVTGSPSWFRSAGDSGSGLERGFCGRCGSQLFVRLDAIPGMLGVRPGTLDDPSTYRPAMDFHVAGAQPWTPMDPSIPKKPGAPRD